MCGRFTLTRGDLRGLALAVGAEVDFAAHGDRYRARYNVAPTDEHWIVRTKHERREMLPARWGLVNAWAADMKGAARQINARSETAARSRAFAEAFEKRRCVVPADGFFEWTGAKEARRPVWFHPPDDESLLLLAGLYESWRDPASQQRTRTFTILTTDANNVVAPVHDRMPVILPPERVDDWLHIPAEGARRDIDVRELLRPAATSVLVATPVSARVNSVSNDDPSCLAPAHERESSESPQLL